MWLRVETLRAEEMLGCDRGNSEHRTITFTPKIFVHKLILFLTAFYIISRCYVLKVSLKFVGC
jgi:hypothetical protein